MTARSRLRSYLRKYKVSQNSLAEKLGVVPATVSMLLSERYPDRLPSLPVAQRIEEFTGGAVRHGDWILTSRHNSEGPRGVRNARTAAVSPRHPTRRSAAGGVK